MSKIRVLIIDDEYLAREIIESFLLKMEDVEIIGTCDNGFEGFKLINELNPDEAHMSSNSFKTFDFNSKNCCFFRIRKSLVTICVSD